VALVNTAMKLKEEKCRSLLSDYQHHKMVSDAWLYIVLCTKKFRECDLAHPAVQPRWQLTCDCSA
jgi:hypothetical protein